MAIDLSRLPTAFESARFLLRELLPGDVSAEYLSWVQGEEAAEFIAYRSETKTELMAYVSEKYDSHYCWFLGIWCRSSGRHVGNIKFEPIDPASAWCVMGILIGAPEYRGKGVGREVMEITIDYLSEIGMREVALGVNKNNLPAIRLYEGMGFVTRPHQGVHLSGESLSMVLRCG